MTKEELNEKMQLLAQLMYGLEQAQLSFDFEHRVETEKIKALKAELKEEVLKAKETLKSEGLEVQYRKGAVKWQTSWLDGYSIDHPEIVKYRSEGKPTVAFVLREDDDGR